MTIHHSAGLSTLGDRGRTVDAPTDDVRGRAVKDEHGESIGSVADLVVDDQSRDRIASAPGYDPQLVDERLHHENLYDYYGYRPFWDWRYTYPSLKLGRSDLGSGT